MGATTSQTQPGEPGHRLEDMFMSTLMRRILTILAVASVFGLAGTAFAQEVKVGEDGVEAKVDGAEVKTGDDGVTAKNEAGTVETKEEAPTLTDEQMDYVAISGTVACYNKRVADAPKANEAIIAYLESEGMNLDEYNGLVKKFQGDNLVQGAIKEEMSLCDTKVLSMPEAEEPEAALTAEEVKEIEKAEKEKTWTYRKKVYKAKTRGGNVKNGRLVFAFKKNGKNAKGNFGGKLDNKTFSVGLSGVRSKHKITLKGNSGKKNSAKAVVTFKKKTIKNYKDTGKPYDHYSTANGKFTGKINGKQIKFSFTAESKK